MKGIVDMEQFKDCSHITLAMAIADVKAKDRTAFLKSRIINAATAKANNAVFMRVAELVRTMTLSLTDLGK
jgi:hypothetical protein